MLDIDTRQVLTGRQMLQPRPITITYQDRGGTHFTSPIIGVFDNGSIVIPAHPNSASPRGAINTVMALIEIDALTYQNDIDVNGGTGIYILPESHHSILSIKYQEED